MTHIEYTLEAIRKAWTQSPHLRLGQLLVNACPHAEANLFYVADDHLRDRLDNYRKKVGSTPGVAE